MKPGKPSAGNTELRLTALPLGDEARVTRIGNGHSSRVFGFGIYAGVKISLLQRYPSYVLRCEETEIALEASVARDIWLERVV